MDEEELKKLKKELDDGIKAIQDKVKILEASHVSKEAIDAQVKETNDKLTKRLDELQVKLNEPRPTLNPNEKSLERKAFVHWARTGEPSQLLTPARFSAKEEAPPELKVMRFSDATTGGYFAVPEIDREIIKNIVEYSPVRSVARVRGTGRDSVQMRKRTGSFSANWVGETTTRTETTGLAYGLETVYPKEMYAMVDVTQIDLEDPDFDIEAELNSEFGEQFGVCEGTAFISGNTTTRPEGMLTNANVGTANSGDANTVAAANFITIYFTPKSGYVKNARWLMRRASMGTIAGLTDNNGNFLLRRLGETPVWTILGADVIECPDMPAIANAAYPILFGDFRQGYTIVDRVGIAVLRDPYTQAANGCVRFWGRKRVGGMVVKSEAIYKVLVQA